MQADKEIWQGWRKLYIKTCKRANVNQGKKLTTLPSSSLRGGGVSCLQKYVSFRPEEMTIRKFHSTNNATVFFWTCEYSVESRDLNGTEEPPPN